MATKEKSGQTTGAAQKKASSRRSGTAASKVEPAKGKLGIMVVGMGAVATTMIAGVEAVRRGLAQPIGSLTQMGTIRLGKRTDSNSPKIKDFVPLANLNDLVFAGWDIFEDNVYEAAAHAQVLKSETLAELKPYLEAIKPMPAVFDRYYVKRLHGTHVKKGTNKRDLAEQVIADIRAFKKTVDRVVMIWCGSTEIFMEPTAVHQTIAAFERGLEKSDIGIAPSQIYAYAALKEGVPFANGAPNLTVDIPALIELSKQNSAPICGKDFKTGQTFMKTVLAPALKARMIGVKGWFSTNILGNRDGEVLDEPQSFKTKEESKLGSLEYIFQPDLYPELYKDIYHKIRINYYPPRGDEKEAWDNIDIFGWLGYPMQLKINFLCRDSILAAPIALDLVLFLDLAKRTPELRSIGIQEWLSFYLKSPQTPPGLYPEHDLFIQSMKLKNTLRHIMGADLVTHLGLDYYD
ncbi:putative myo-inositol-1-phosphate synthase [Candidatus Sulfotelmatomonas gaucii]|uniref:Putative myo-inositol-1-phosphate synthase n=1 Tax=Candidatus Sulfuritelmatomonas gaucii TaxID=2043161 RepID=A0A2N9M6X5_9BACT|nr:putative myo-inositol-1-phosphate synthase [Candidatus Sulfotelmatomonas gaucii]